MLQCQGLALGAVQLSKADRNLYETYPKYMNQKQLKW